MVREIEDYSLDFFPTPCRRIQWQDGGSFAHDPGGGIAELHHPLKRTCSFGMLKARHQLFGGASGARGVAARIRGARPS